MILQVSGPSFYSQLLSSSSSPIFPLNSYSPLLIIPLILLWR